MVAKQPADQDGPQPTPAEGETAGPEPNEAAASTPPAPEERPATPPRAPRKSTGKGARTVSGATTDDTLELDTSTLSAEPTTAPPGMAVPGTAAAAAGPAVPAAAGSASSGPAQSDPDVLLGRLQALEAENAHLRTLATTPPPPAGPPHRARRFGRAFASVVLLVIAAILAPIAVVTVWADDLASDTDRFVATVAPLSEDPTIQSAVTNRVTTAIVEGLDFEGVASDLTTGVADLGLPPRLSALVLSLQGPLVDAATNVVRKGVDKVVTSPAFSAAWEEANRTVHEQLVAVLEDDPDALASISADGTLSVDLSSVIEAVKTALSDAGFTIVDRLPTINATFPLMQSDDLVTLQNSYRALNTLGTWLPWLVVGLLVAGVLTARHRARAVVVAGLLLAAGMVLLGLALNIGRQVYADSLPDTVQRTDAAVVVYDQVVSLLRIGLRSIFVVGIVVAIVAFLVGGTTAAVALRRSWNKGATALRTAGDRRGVSTGPVGRFLGEQRVLVWWVVGIGAALALVLAGHLTPAYVATVAIVAAVLLVLVSLLARPPEPEVDALVE